MAKDTFGNKAIMEKEFEGAPEWVAKGCSAYLKKHNDERTLCGVGSSLSKNPSEARTVAVVKARAEIARNIQIHVTSILKDYSVTTTGKQELARGNYQRIEDYSEQITRMALPGSEVIDYWVSKNGTLYALVVLAKGQFKDSINQINGISKDLKENIIERAEKTFKEIDSME